MIIIIHNNKPTSVLSLRLWSSLSSLSVKMNPLTNMKNLQKMNERELSMGLVGTAGSWHNQYKDSAWIFVGGLPFALSEGDIITVFSQYGEIVNINLVRDKGTGKSKGFCFICYEDQRSTILAVDNFNGIELSRRLIRVDHVMNYKVPKEYEEDDELTKKLKWEGCAPAIPKSDQSGDESLVDVKSEPKESKKKKKKKKKHKHSRHSSEEPKIKSENNLEEGSKHKSMDFKVKIKIEKEDESYNQYDRRDDGKQNDKNEYDTKNKRDRYKVRRVRRSSSYDKNENSPARKRYRDRSSSSERNHSKEVRRAGPSREHYNQRMTDDNRSKRRSVERSRSRDRKDSKINRRRNRSESPNDKEKSERSHKSKYYRDDSSPESRNRRRERSPDRNKSRYKERERSMSPYRRNYSSKSSMSGKYEHSDRPVSQDRHRRR